MISAPFLAGCPSALDRAWSVLLTRGVVDLFGWPSPVAALAYLLPAVVVSCAALWTWHRSSSNGAVVVALFAVAVHPPLLLALAPLLARRPQASGWTRHGIRLAVVLLGALVLAGVVAPECGSARSASAIGVLRGTAAILRQAVGPLAAVLALFETVRCADRAHVRVGWLVFGCSVVAVIVFQSFDGRVSLAGAIVVGWWLALHGAVALVTMRPTAAARVGAAALMTLVPMLQLWAAANTMATIPHPTTATGDVLQSLGRMWRPAVLLSETAVHDLVANAWAVGDRRRGTSFRIVDAADAERAATEGRSVYSFTAGALELQRRGLLMAPLEPPSAALSPILWRAFSGPQCVRVTGEWRDLTALAANGQVSGVFEQGATGRHALLYVALPADGTVHPIAWPEVAIPGLRLSGFDLTNANDRRQYYQAALADEMPLTLIPPETRRVARVLLGRIERTPGALAIAFNTVPARIAARLDNGANTDRLDLCRSAQELAVVGFREGLTRLALNVWSPAPIGTGWHQAEREGDLRFRWTAADSAELRFIALEPARAALTLHVADAAGGRRDATSVQLNGVSASCESRGDRCTWMLPVEAMTTGLNTITLTAPATPAANGATLGLKVAGADLSIAR